MPKYKVTTDRGTFMVELDKPPSSQQELMEVVQEQLSGAAPAQPGRRLSGDISPEIGAGLRVARQAAIPVAAGIAAPLVGGAAGLGAGAIAGLEATFGVGAEALNQALGITEPSVAQMGLAGAAGPAGRLVGGVGRAAKAGVMRRLPGASTTLHEMAAESAEQMGTRLLPGIPSDDLFALSRQMGNPTIATPKLKAAAEELLRVESKLPGFDISALKRQAKGLLKEIETGGGQLDLETINLLRQRIGPLTKSMQNVPKDVAARSETQLLAGLFDDLDDAVRRMGPTSSAANLKVAIEAARKESASKRLSRILSPEGGGISVRPADGVVIVKPGKILQALESDKAIQKFGDPAVMAEIKKEVQAWMKLPAAPPIRSQQRGAGILVGRGAIGLAGGMAFGEPGTGVAVAMLAPEIIAASLQTSTGRFLLRRALAEKGFLDHGNLSMLMQIARAGFAPQPGETLNVGPTPQ